MLSPHDRMPTAHKRKQLAARHERFKHCAYVWDRYCCFFALAPIVLCFSDARFMRFVAVLYSLFFRHVVVFFSAADSPIHSRFSVCVCIRLLLEATTTTTMCLIVVVASPPGLFWKHKEIGCIRLGALWQILIAHWCCCSCWCCCCS